jgi:hypothetical protein
MPTGPRQPDAPKPDPKTPAPVVKLTDCPNCGRKEVAVFPVVHPDRPADTARLVCPDCCPKPDGNGDQK